MVYVFLTHLFFDFHNQMSKQLKQTQDDDFSSQSPYQKVGPSTSHRDDESQELGCKCNPQLLIS